MATAKKKPAAKKAAPAKKTVAKKTAPAKKAPAKKAPAKKSAPNGPVPNKKAPAPVQAPVQREKIAIMPLAPLTNEVKIPERAQAPKKQSLLKRFFFGLK
jgi:hypothetical protein